MDQRTNMLFYFKLGKSAKETHEMLLTVYDKSAVTTENSPELKFLAKKGIVSVNHPPYSPHLSGPDFFLFPKLKTALKGQRFSHIQRNVTTQLKEEFPSTTTAAASQPSTAAPEPSAAAGSPLGRDGERGQRTYKTVGSWELGGGVKASVVQSSDGAFVNFRAKTVQLWTVFVCPQQHGTTFQRKC
ncbi:hypothetical protein AVEN_126249-1 [Araneus ventricosus]|uniref:Mos1 transposase HTH domain-containing protein n=1 Tax=Araneus ventricosus TaxID=182803 RepID=A0A4Y2L357_ARAVE|nr:hypothetical protein AVEN_126249-1 [Araneus ventricosus]